jgi:hypothetical protein
MGKGELFVPAVCFPPYRKERGRMGHPHFWWCQETKNQEPLFRYSVRKAFIGSMLAARLAGMKPAKAASTNTAPASVSGS